SVNQAAPSGATASAVSPALGVGTGNSSNSPSAKRPTLLAASSRNQTAPSALTATSPRPLVRVGTSTANFSPFAAMRRSLLARGSVVQPAPSGAIATPKGAASIGSGPPNDPTT